MSRIFKNMLPYWKAVIIIIALLFVQAWCDLSLPAYTSDIIDVGIQNNGVEHVVPEKITHPQAVSGSVYPLFDYNKSCGGHGIYHLSPVLHPEDEHLL